MAAASRALRAWRLLVAAALTLSLAWPLETAAAAATDFGTISSGQRMSASAGDVLRGLRQEGVQQHQQRGLKALPVVYSDANYTMQFPVRICMTWFTAVAECNSSMAVSEYTGYDVDLMRRMLAQMVANDFTRFRDVEWVCATDYEAMIGSLKLPRDQRQCDMAIGGVGIASVRIVDGVQYSVSTLKGGSLLMIHVGRGYNLFMFLNPFSQTLWLVLFATTVGVAIVIWLQEAKWSKVARHPGRALRQWESLQFSTVGILLQGVEDAVIQTIGGRITILGYCFLVVIIINMYIAVLSSQMTVTSLAMNIQGLSDVLSDPVGVEATAVDLVRRYNLLNIVPFPWNTRQDEEDMVTAVRDGRIRAMLIDAPFATYESAMHCDIYTVGDVVLPSDYGVALAYDTPKPIVDAINYVLTSLSEEGIYEQLQQKYLSPDDGCPNKESSNTATMRIDFLNVAGLWIFLFAAVGSGTIINFGIWVYEWRKARAEEAAKKAGAKAGSSSDDSFTIKPNGELPDKQELEDASQEDLVMLMQQQLQAMYQHLRRLDGSVQAVEGKVQGIGLDVSAMRSLLEASAGGKPAGLLEASGVGKPAGFPEASEAANPASFPEASKSGKVARLPEVTKAAAPVGMADGLGGQKPAVPEGSRAGLLGPLEGSKAGLLGPSEGSRAGPLGPSEGSRGGKLGPIGGSEAGKPALGPLGSLPPVLGGRTPGLQPLPVLGAGASEVKSAAALAQGMQGPAAPAPAVLAPAVAGEGETASTGASAASGGQVGVAGQVAPKVPSQAKPASNQVLPVQ